MRRSLGLALDPARPEPLYQQIFEAVADRIRSGAFPPGFRLPPTRTLAAELGAHRNTVVRAYAELTEAGFLDGSVGRGTYVKARSASGGSGETAQLPGVLPWGTMLSARAREEPLARARRLRRVAGHCEFINLTRMQPAPDLVPEALFRRCLDHVMRTMGGRALGYAPHEGVPALRELIAKDLARQGVPARAEEVLVTSGSQQAIDLIARALVDPGDSVIAQELTYGGAVEIFAAAGARMLGAPSDGQGPDMTWLRGAGRPKVVYLMPSHVNPTGECIAHARREELAAYSREVGVPLVEDDYAADLDLDGVPAPPSLRALSGDAIYISTYSKRLIPALRIGFVLCPPALAPHLASLKHATDLGTSTLMQYALAEFLDRGYLEPHVERIRVAYRERREALVRALEKHLPSAIRFTVASRGVTVFLWLPPDLDPEHVFEEARRRGVLVSPSTLHRADRASPAPAGVRLTFCVEKPARLEEGARRLGAALDAVRRARGKRGVESLAMV